MHLCSQFSSTSFILSVLDVVFSYSWSYSAVIYLICSGCRLLVVMVLFCIYLVHVVTGYLLLVIVFVEIIKFGCLQYSLLMTIVTFLSYQEEAVTTLGTGESIVSVDDNRSRDRS